eukprot:gnl/Trimastix_PCT/2890.p1 GENE.gnl/Trimastix_PCT/2890~~gnl/Trimastix_PCT/2890.p1  ORF type:complete len:329 (+),score=45.96 gnl/Trimastix_PCT/2890:60-1046(+)
MSEGESEVRPRISLPHTKSHVTSIPPFVFTPVLVGTTCEDNQPNFTTIASFSVICFTPPRLVGLASMNTNLMNKNIKRTKTFSINIMDSSFSNIVDFCGVHSGGKSSLFETFPGFLPSAPLITQSIFAIECKLRSVLEFEHNEFFIAEIFAQFAENDLIHQLPRPERSPSSSPELAPSGSSLHDTTPCTFDLSRFRPLVYTTGYYYTLQMPALHSAYDPSASPPPAAVRSDGSITLCSLQAGTAEGPQGCSTPPLSAQGDDVKLTEAPLPIMLPAARGSSYGVRSPRLEAEDPEGEVVAQMSNLNLGAPAKPVAQTTDGQMLHALNAI